MTLAARLRKIVGDLRVALGIDRLPSYSRSRAELGGVPWRTLDATDRWFLESAESLAAVSDSSIELAPSLPGMVVRKQKARPPVATSEISGVVNLRTPGLPWWIYVGAVGLVALIVVIFRS
jgi:hypothetical protein